MATWQRERSACRQAGSSAMLNTLAQPLPASCVQCQASSILRAASRMSRRKTTHTALEDMGSQRRAQMEHCMVSARSELT